MNKYIYQGRFPFTQSPQIHNPYRPSMGGWFSDAEAEIKDAWGTATSSDAGGVVGDIIEDAWENDGKVDVEETMTDLMVRAYGTRFFKMGQQTGDMIVDMIAKSAPFVSAPERPNRTEAAAKKRMAELNKAKAGNAVGGLGGVYAPAMGGWMEDLAAEAKKAQDAAMAATETLMMTTFAPGMRDSMEGPVKSILTKYTLIISALGIASGAGVTYLLMRKKK